MKLIVDNYPYVDSARLFAKVADQAWAIYLDSGIIQGKSPTTKHADFDVLAIKPETTLVTQGANTVVTTKDKSTTHRGDPLVLLREMIPEVDNDGKHRYVPGALGYFSYDLARQFESLPSMAMNDENLPEMAMGIYSAIVLIDHRKKMTSLISIDLSTQTTSIINEWQNLIESVVDDKCIVETEQFEGKLICHEMIENMDIDQYQTSFETIRDYTIAGDCYQVNFSKRFAAEVTGDSWQTYQHLRNLSPAPYGAFINLPFGQILSNSPESFIQCRHKKVVSSPIKGTSPRDHKDKKNDLIIAEKLSNSAKDQAENLMIVDLMRNDLSRCCELGSVKVPKLFALHSFANVHHLISTITGTLKKGLHSLDLLRSCFPGGSITGTPKIRAMEIIEELEPHRRGLYCGSIGYVGVDGHLETNIAIRTIVVKGGVARYSAGGGLVIDSDVSEEYQELIDKASMMTAALVD